MTNTGLERRADEQEADFVRESSNPNVSDKEHAATLRAYLRTLKELRYERSIKGKKIC